MFFFVGIGEMLYSAGLHSLNQKISYTPLMHIFVLFLSLSSGEDSIQQMSTQDEVE